MKRSVIVDTVNYTNSRKVLLYLKYVIMVNMLIMPIVCNYANYTNSM